VLQTLVTRLHGLQLLLQLPLQLLHDKEVMLELRVEVISCGVVEERESIEICIDEHQFEWVVVKEELDMQYFVQG
jgi:hypothetical protein